ncbi:NAD(P)-dependent oxidoreductase [Plantactinospora sonchi]|uniref:NAD(P)-binding domain-containing protein n=1 Tax=Plantactinospora sonchi TaxID=1544735 RepID=A0ABU7RMI4_9ACTN
MEQHASDTSAHQPLTLLGLGAMGTALARAWLAARHPLTVWNRSQHRAAPLAAEGATVAGTAAEAVAASRLVVVCLLDDESVRQTLADTDLTGRDVVNLSTGTPGQARALARWVEDRGARFLDGGIMAVPPMIGVPDSGGYILYSGSTDAFEAYRHTLAVPAGTRYVGADPGFAALHDVALLSAMTGMFSGIAHAFALIRREEIAPKEFAPLLAEWLAAMAGSAHLTAAQLESGDHTTGVASNLAMMVTANATLLRTAEEQGVSTELLTPYTGLMADVRPAGQGAESHPGGVDLLLR